MIGSFTYWQSRYNDAIITSEITPVAGNTGIASQANDKLLPFSFNPGFKIGVGTNLDKLGWSPMIMWTYMHSSPSKKWTSGSHNLLADLMLSSAPGNTLLSNNVQAKWNLNFNAIDIEFGKETPVSSYFMTRMFGSIKLASISNKLNVTYKNIVDAKANNWADESYKATNQSWLVGPRGGTNIYFGLAKDFGFMATTATYVYACMLNPEVTKSIATPLGTPIGSIEKTKDTNIGAGFDLYLGLNWGHCFKNKGYMNVSAGYEFQYYGAVISEVLPLSFNGLNASVVFEF